MYLPEGLLDRLTFTDPPLAPGAIRGAIQFSDEMFRQTHILKKQHILLNDGMLSRNIINWNRGVRELVLSIGLFTRRGKYVPGVKSYEYLLTDRSVKWKLHKLNDRYLRRSLERRHGKVCGNLNDVEKWLKGQLDRVRFDWGRLVEAKNMAHQDYIRSTRRGGRNRKSKRKLWQQYVLAEGIFQQIEDRQYWFLKDDFAGRIHTPITSLPKVARQFLLGPSGKPLVEIDIACSQPLFAAIVSRESGYLCPQYLKDCESGVLYNVILNEINDAEITTRKQAKTAMFRYLYRDCHSTPEPIDKFIAKKYPELNDFVRKEKCTDIDGNTRLAQLMQQLESRLVIWEVCGNLMSAHPAQFALTVHDSLMVEQSLAETVVKLLKSSFSALDVHPTLSF